jgi:peptide/nickel transport system substrate-binding protein
MPAIDPGYDLAVAYNQLVYSKLTDIDEHGVFQMELAESMEPNAAVDTWVVKLKQGVEFHDGSTLTADDVIWSLRWLLDPSHKIPGAVFVSMIDPHGLRKIDRTTLEIKLTTPWSALPIALGQRFVHIVKDGSRPPRSVAEVNGTGAFRLTGWEPGRKRTLKAFEHYFRHGQPYVDGIELLGISDTTARINALVSGTVDAASAVPPSQIGVLRSRGLETLIAPGGSWTGVFMDTTRAPFDDVRVRQAMKLLMDRKQAIEANGGIGELGNDLFARRDVLYASDLPQRQFDPEQAKSLLKQAGALDHEFTLYSSAVQAEMTPIALVLQQAARSAGLKFTVKDVAADSYYQSAYVTQPFAFTALSYRPLLAQWPLSFGPLAGPPADTDTRWRDGAWRQASRLIAKVAATPDEQLQKQYAHDAQQLLWEDGGYIIPFLVRPVDGYSAKVRGLVPSPFTYLGFFKFWNVWLG